MLRRNIGRPERRASQDGIDEFVNGTVEKIIDISVGQLSQELEVASAAEHEAQVGQHCSTVGKAGTNLGRVRQEIQRCPAAETAEVHPGLLAPVLRTQETPGGSTVSRDELGDPPLTVGIGVHLLGILGQYPIPPDDLAVEGCANQEGALGDFELEYGPTLTQPARDTPAPHRQTGPNEIRGQSIEAYPEVCAIIRALLQPKMSSRVDPILGKLGGVMPRHRRSVVGLRGGRHPSER
jgi:hypothetical protein